MTNAHHATIVEEIATILANVQHPGDQFVMRVHAPKIAQKALPGQFVHIQVSPERPMRRPISIMLTNPEQGTVDLLIKAIGEGTERLRQRKVDEQLPMMGPIGHPFDLADPSKRYILIGGGVGIPPMIFVADHLQGQAETILFAGSEVPFPFALKPSTFLLPGIDSSVKMTIASLESRDIPCRLASKANMHGCFDGYVADLARSYLQALPQEERQRCVLLSCGPHPMLQSVAKLAHDLNIPAQLSLEEHMACAIGGCAGCVVETLEQGKRYYRRICVDGPVFDLNILPEFAA
ncbi:MAG: dihydroorotate dehydrogenase electron transfer subunit [Zetaproteobacteria bacterium]|nr:dihydroorotate dehydrogenase electron transfer subunit [Zetaproteobacteria bacterium]